jgi:hypothetical protein
MMRCACSFTSERKARRRCQQQYRRVQCERGQQRYPYVQCGMQVGSYSERGPHVLHVVQLEDLTLLQAESKHDRFPY